MNPRFPVYIITYKRWDSRLTVKALENMGVPYKIVIDGEDYDKYAEVIDKKNILILPPEYRKNYDKFWKDDGPTGSGAARNFVWDHAVKTGKSHHWIMDDNIDSFLRFTNGRKIKVNSGTVLRIMEDFILRYDNVAISGPNYDYFCVQTQKYPPITINTRVFSCLLIRNDIPFRWRGRYNEDVDLNIRVMKAGWCTIQFNAFLQGKAPTQTVKGGNNLEFYQKEGTYKKSKMLYDMHPDITRIVWRFKRWHHFVDYSKFRKNKLKKKKGFVIKKGSNNYGMVLKPLSKEKNG